MELVKTSIYFIIITIILACGSVNTTSNKIPKPLVGKDKGLFVRKPNHLYFTILQLNDVTEIAPIKGDFGGLARVETIHKALLKENPNTMIVMAGGFLNSSLLGTIKHNGELIKGRQMVEVLNAMAFDLVTFGDDEFDLNYQELQERLNDSDFDWVSGNVLHNNNGQAYYFHKIKNGMKETIFDSYSRTVYDGKNSLKVGFVSVSSPSNPKSYVAYGDIYIEIVRSYNELKDKADIILGLTHLDLVQDREIAKTLPNIPLIMGGNNNNPVYEKEGNVRISKADPNAKTVYIHRFDYNTISNKLVLKSELLTIDDSIVEDTEIAKIVAKWQKLLDN